MTNVDLYQKCPCGSGKKLKFCCGAELAHDLDQIAKAMEGQQRVAALDLVQRSLATKGARPALLALQIQIALQSERFDVAEQAVREFLRLRPKDPGVAALKSIVLAMKGDLRGAIDTLHDALELVVADGPVPGDVAIAFQQVGMSLLALGSGMAALAHLGIASQLLGHSDRELFSMIQQLNVSKDIPLATKEVPPLAACPAGAAWKTEFEAAIKTTELAMWRKARNQFRLLAESHPQEPAIIKNLAITQALLGDPKATAANWRLYSRLPNLPLDEAVEAELFAQLEDPSESAAADIVMTTYAVADVNACQEHLLSDRRCHSSPVDTANWNSENGPPPKSIFILLDRPAPPHGESLTLETLPQVLGTFLLYGRETDRPARIVSQFVRDDRYDLAVGLLKEIAGSHLGERLDEGAAGSRDLREQVASVGVFPPKDTPTELQLRLTIELRQKTLRERWAKLPLWECGGKSAIDAAKEPKYRIPLLAVILELELGYQQAGSESDCNDLRQFLGLPTLDAIDPAAVTSWERLPLVRLGRVRPEALSKELLAALLNRCTMRAFRYGQRVFATEGARREGAENANLALGSCEVLVSISYDYDEAYQWIERGRAIAAAHQVAATRLKVLEMEVRLMRGDVDTFVRLLEELLVETREDKETAMVLFATLNRLGLITPDGRIMVPRRRAAAPGPLGAPAGAPAGSTTPGGLWTPESGGGGVPAPPPPPGKSKLWIPGMD